MVGIMLQRVKPATRVTPPLCRAGVARGRLRSRTETFVTAVALLLAALLAAVAFMLWRRPRRPSPHQRALREVLDAADALEDRLRIARAEIEAVAGDHGPNPVGDAMREMLRQRLWLRDHSHDATPAQLADVRDAIHDARGRIEQELVRIEEARLPRD
jgi:hypothetical protein